MRLIFIGQSQFEEIQKLVGVTALPSAELHFAAGSGAAVEAYSGLSVKGPSLFLLGLAGNAAGCRYVLRLAEEVAVASGKPLMQCMPMGDVGDVMQAEGWVQLDGRLWSKVTGEKAATPPPVPSPEQVSEAQEAKPKRKRRRRRR